MRLDAYYYGFDATGIDLIDSILSAVACAGTAFHDTSEWTDESRTYEDVHRGETPIDWIQNAANDAAADLRTARERIADLEAALGEATDLAGNLNLLLRGEQLDDALGDKEEEDVCRSFAVRERRIATWRSLLAKEAP